ncbi:large T antigen [Miniopterus schreibersii polyomavirus 1]|uniref:DNA 3'-5' helicase n=1 Tax=Miniopterus schreibersii polyomavirus 1 TaxID=1904408 RepID=A0A1S7J005_9POLY|nr:large T antigen [Miniopterus schreibersii polyomavirus 1]BAX01863.2 large T antigen [Miniopterus schreibersii polyomavirus 1]BAX01869.2 large T antigen [Miniopterus schreibersii polyomavirus 1]BAX01875.2 large T antigen [Miniopterus schreibersii polyomavirus 1]
MDRLLEKKEREQLVELLEVHPQAFYNVPIMKTAFKKACKKWHPDKGGDTTKMTLLNSLWQRYQQGVIGLRSSQVYSDAYGSPSFKEKYRAWASGVFTHEGSQPEPDLHCDESCDSDSGESTESPPQSSGYNSFTPGGGFSASTSTPEEDPTPPFGEPSFSQASSHASSSNGSRDPREEPSPKRARYGENVDGSCPSSQASFASTPPKEKAKMGDSPTDLPSCLFEYISHAVFTNKTFNNFIVFSTLEKVTLLYEKCDFLKIEFKSLHKIEEGPHAGTGLLLLLTTAKHRVTAVKNHCSKFCTVSFLVTKIVLKPLEIYRCLCQLPFKELKCNKVLCSADFDESKEESCSWAKVAEFAVEAQLEDPLLILAHYLDFATNPPCAKCNNLKTKAHSYHAEHHLNALLFLQCKNQKGICNQAADTVLAKRRLLLVESTRQELLTMCFEKQLEKLKKLDELDIMTYMAGVAWYACLFEEFDQLVYKILRLFTENVPKNRNVLFRGPVNTGKTTFAAALMDLLDGKCLNVNCPADKLSFELGCAMDRFCVCFEDVKGQTMLNKKLSPGQGISNLDNMRDYLDGAVKVNLEKKHMNKRSQIFPPAVVTMNEYVLPQTLFIRFCLKLNFTQKNNLQEALDKTPSLLSGRILQQGLTLFLLLIWYFPNTQFSPSLREEIATWKEIVSKTVSYSTFCKMLENVEAGDSPLHDIMDEEEAQ